MLDRMQMFFSKGRNPSGCSVYFVIGNADELFDQRGNEVEVVDARDREYGIRDYGARPERLPAVVRA
jgi:hypothetical protein